MARTYDDYTRDKIGWFFGLRGWQLGVLAVTATPVFLALQRTAWSSAATFAGLWVLVLVVTAMPVRGRSATGWLLAATATAVGGTARWSVWRSPASRGHAHDLAVADLPGVLHGIQVHDGPPRGAAMSRTAIIQHHAQRTWAVTAQVTHPGIGMAGATERDRYGAGLSQLLDVAARTGLVDELLIMVRTVPDDGAERDLWLARQQRAGAPVVSRQVNDDLRQALTGAAVRTETFVTVVVPEARIGRPAREAGGGLDGRARVLYGVLAEVEQQLRGPLAMTAVTWLTSPQLALACRTGFAPGDRAGLVEAMARRDHHPDQDPGVNADVPWAMAGPSGADTAARQYSHDAWNSVSATLQLPANGAVLGSLAPVLTPTEAGERRSYAAVFPIMTAGRADRATANAEWAADLGEELRTRAKVRPRARTRAETGRARTVDAKLALGAALVRPYAVCTVTVPKTMRVAEFGRRLDAAVRAAGFAPLRLDLSQDVGFACSTVPLGVDLARGGR